MQEKPLHCQVKKKKKPSKMRLKQLTEMNFLRSYI